MKLVVKVCILVMLAQLSPLAVSVSSAASRVAYLRLASDFWQVWTMGDDGSDGEALSKSQGDKTHVVWRPGTALAPELLYHTSTGSTFLVDVATGAERSILTDHNARDASFSADGNRIAFESVTPSGSELSLYHLETGEVRKVVGGLRFPSQPVWLSDDVLMLSHGAFALDRGLSFGLVELSLARNNATRIIPGDDESILLTPSATTSSDGTLLAYASRRSGFQEIWLLPVRRGERRQLTHLESYASSPSWSPEGDALVFQSELEGDVSVYRIGSDGTELKRLTSGAPSRRPSWGPASAGGAR